MTFDPDSISHSKLTFNFRPINHAVRPIIEQAAITNEYPDENQFVGSNLTLLLTDI